MSYTMFRRKKVLAEWRRADGKMCGQKNGTNDF